MNLAKNCFLLGLILLVVFACKFGGGDQKGSEAGGENDKTVSETPVETEATPEDDVATIPDIDFPEDAESADVLEDDEDKEEESGPKNKTRVVKFAKGKSARTLSDAVIRGESHTYRLGASAGQMMAVRISSLESNAGFYVKAPNGKYLGKGTAENSTTTFIGKLPASGRYSIVVAPTRGNATYKISFAITGGKKADKPENSTTVESVGGLTTVVRFKKGATSASYKNAVIRGESNKYILGASGGQLMSVSVSSIEDNAVLRVQAPNGRILTSGRKSWSGQLPADGKYRILVSPTRGNATYTVRFAVR